MEIEAVLEDDSGFAAGTPIHVSNRYGSMSPCTEVCEVCLSRPLSSSCARFDECGHRFCPTCISTAYEQYIKEGKTITCLHCSTPAHPQIVKDHVTQSAYDRYLNHTLRHYLATHQPNVRQCTAPDCSYAYIIDNPSNCEDYHFVCQREGCNTEYCTKCKRAWHEGISCKKARKQQGKKQNSPIAEVLGEDVLKSVNIKQCPRCGTGVEKIDDGGCNHVMCHICKLEFCWLCLKPGTELHYLSPTGCPMYGRRRWPKWKTWLLRISLWTGAPLIVFVLFWIVFFVSLFLLPILIIFLIHSACFENLQSRKAKAVGITTCVAIIILAYLLSPILSLLLAILVVPLALLYFYCYIPIHLVLTNRPQRLQTSNPIESV